MLTKNNFKCDRFCGKCCMNLAFKRRKTAIAFFSKKAEKGCIPAAFTKTGQGYAKNTHFLAISH